MTAPAVLARAQEHDLRWREALADEGLHPQRLLLITSVLDAVPMDVVVGTAAPDAARSGARDELRSLLMALSRGDGPVVAPI
jgi:hypothetical protein